MNAFHRLPHWQTVQLFATHKPLPWTDQVPTPTPTASAGSNPLNGAAFSPSATANYSVSGTNSLTGCTSTNVAFVTVTVNPLPVVSANTSTTALCCVGNPVTLNGGGANTYTGLPVRVLPPTTWLSLAYHNGHLFGGGTNTLTGCTSTNAAAVTVTVYTLPVVAPIQRQQLFAAHSPSPWQVVEPAPIPNASIGGSYTNGAAFAPTATAVYSVTGTSSVGCLKL